MEQQVEIQPRTYQDWLNYFETIENIGVNQQSLYIQGIVDCNFNTSPVIYRAFKQRLLSLINNLLNQRFKIFIKKVNLSMSLGEYEGIELYFKRLKPQINDVLLLCDLKFLESDFRNCLKNAVCEQVQDLINRYVRLLDDSSWRIRNEQLSEAIILIKKWNV